MVPAEVLGKIFHLLCDEPIDVGPHIFGINNNFPWAVGRVCRQWRCGFISYPPIWTSIRFSDVCVVTEDPGVEAARRIAMYLGRSRELPLDIDVCVSFDASVPALRLFLACAHRWRTARISIGKEELMDELFACRGNMPILESLDICAPRLVTGYLGDDEDPIDYSHDIQVGEYDVFEIAPQVHTIKLKCGDTIIRWALPWSQLTKLHVIMSTLFDVPALLQELRSVEELLFEFSGVEYRITENLSLFDGFSVRLEHLRVLQAPFPMILSWIEAPLLQELRLGDPNNLFCPRLPHRMQLLSLIHRSGPSCQIRRLVLRGDDIVTVNHIISALADVEELHICTPEYKAIIYDHSPSKYVYRILSKLADLNNHLYLPTLRRIAIAFDPEGTHSAMVKKVSRLLKSRRVRQPTSTLAVAPLESVAIQMVTSSLSETQLPTELVEARRKWPPFVEVGFKSKYH